MASVSFLLDRHQFAKFSVSNPLDYFEWFIEVFAGYFTKSSVGSWLDYSLNIHKVSSACLISLPNQSNILSAIVTLSSLILLLELVTFKTRHHCVSSTPAWSALYSAVSQKECVCLIGILARNLQSFGKSVQQFWVSGVRQGQTYDQNQQIRAYDEGVRSVEISLGRPLTSRSTVCKR